MYEKFPRSIQEKKEALEKVILKKDVTPIEEWFISEITSTKIEEIFPVFMDEIKERGEALSLQNQASMKEDIMQEKLRKHVAHFVRVFNLGIERGVYSASERSYFEIDINNTSIPHITSETALLTWARSIINGDKKRMLRPGAVPMSNPTTAEVDKAMNEFITSSKDQMAAIENFDKEMKNVNALLPQVDELIRDIWDEVNFHYRKETDSNRRKLARQYGVVYATRNEAGEEIIVEEELTVE